MSRGAQPNVNDAHQSCRRVTQYIARSLERRVLGGIILAPPGALRKSLDQIRIAWMHPQLVGDGRLFGSTKFCSCGIRKIGRGEP